MSRLLWSLALLPLVAADARAQRVQLELRPRAGDTLTMRLDQVTEMSGSTKTGGAGSKPVVTILHMYSRAIVESSTASAAVILAVTDSVEVRTSDARANALAQQTHSQLAGRSMRLRVSPDGTVGVAGQPGSVPREVTDLVSVMPASFPRHVIAVGDTWVREMPIPPAARLGVPAGGLVRASFRLDSVTRGGDVAYVSMRGALQQVAMLPGPVAAHPALSGTVNGSMVLDRRRGWLSESRFLVQMRTTVMPREGQGLAPMYVRMKITQHMRVIDKR